MSELRKSDCKVTKYLAYKQMDFYFSCLQSFFSLHLSCKSILCDEKNLLYLGSMLAFSYFLVR